PDERPPRDLAVEQKGEGEREEPLGERDPEHVLGRDPEGLVEERILPEQRVVPQPVEHGRAHEIVLIKAQPEGLEHRIELEGREVDERRKDEQEPCPAEASADEEPSPPDRYPPNEGKLDGGRRRKPAGRDPALHRVLFIA